MRYHPCSLQIRADLGDLAQNCGYARRRPGCEGRLLIVWGLYTEGKKNGAQECDGGENDERKTTKATDITKGIFRLTRLFGSFISEISLSYPCRAVEQERKPACGQLATCEDSASLPETVPIQAQN